MPLRTAVVGAGVVSDIHMSALDECPRTELVAVCDLDEERARTAARRYGIQAVFDVEELLAEGNLDWVHVCTPVQTHLDIARLAIEAGVPVNIEKPVTETVAEAEELTRLSENYGVPVSVTHQHRFDPAMRAAEARLRAGELGELRAANLLYTGETPPDQANRGEWAFDLVGGEFEEGLPHPLYILLGAAGYPEEGTIQALTQLHGEYERSFGYDGTTVSYRSESGTLASVTCLGGAPPQKILFLHGADRSLNVDFVSQTVIEVDHDFNGSPQAKVRNNVSRAADRLAGTAKNVYQVGRERLDDDWDSTRRIDSHAYQIDAEARALQAGSELPVPLAEGRWTIALMEAVREASAEGQPTPPDEHELAQD
jgi:predicted dehydrogenase